MPVPPDTIKPSAMYSRASAARLLGVHQHSVDAWIAAGKLRESDPGSPWPLSGAELLRFLGKNGAA